MAGWEEIPTQKLPPAAKHALAVINACDGVIPNTASVWGVVPEEGSADVIAVRVTLKVAIGSPSRNVENRINDIEEVALEYGKIKEIGINGPSSILCLREDFPRDIPHLNLVSNAAPVEPCIAWVRLPEFHQVVGIVGIIGRIREWLTDARANNLHKNGWHPAPIGTDGKYLSVLDLAYFQELASALDGKWTMGCLGIIEEKVDFDYAAEKYLDVAAFEKLKKKIIKHKKYGEPDGWAVPWILVAHPTSHECASPFFKTFTKLSELKQALKSEGILTLDQALAEISAREISARRAGQHNDQVIGIVVGIRRPEPLERTWPGLSENPDARRYEVKTYVAILPTGKAVHEADGEIHRVRNILAPSAPLYRHISKMGRLAEAAIIGVGAIGGHIAEHLIRCGAESLTVIDNDKLEPHNLARHIGRKTDLFSYKVSAIERLSSDLGLEQWSELTGVSRGTGSSVSVIKPRHFSITSAPDAELDEAFLTSAAVIDCTANPEARTRIVKYKSPTAKHYVRTEIFHGGKLGILSVGALNGAPDLSDLYLYLISLSDDDWVSSWLKWERQGGLRGYEVMLGMGCASLTTQMPGYIVSAHAASFMPDLIRILSKRDDVPPGLGLNCIDAEGRPLGWRWYPVGPFRIDEIPGSDWSVRWKPGLWDFIDEQRAKAHPSETGGYLYGKWDYVLKRITIISATSAPPDTMGTVTSLSLGAANDDGVGRAILRRSAGRIELVGTWHSHPGSSPMPSPRDLLTVAPMAMENSKRGIPTLMVIKAERNCAIALSIGDVPLEEL